MANTTSTSLKLTVQATGENSGTWGQITNTNFNYGLSKNKLFQRN